MADSDSPTSAMIFAAGFGTRMGVLTRDRPKPLIEVAGRTLLDRAIEIAAAEAGRIVVNAHYLSDQIATHLLGRGIRVMVEKPDILDTGGGLRAAMPELGEGPVFTLNPDVIWTGSNPMAQLKTKWRFADMQALLLLIPVDMALGRVGSGDFSMDDSGRLTRGGDLIYSGAQITKTGELAQIPEGAFSLNRLWDTQIADGTLFGTIHAGGWCDVGYPEAILLAEGMLSDG